MNDNEIAKKETALALPTEEEVALAFGGEAAADPIAIRFPSIELTKTDNFQMPDGSTVKKIVCYIVFAQRSRAWFKKTYAGKDSEGVPPDCSSRYTLKPDAGENMQRGPCGDKRCPKATWYKEKDENGVERNHVDCKESLNTLLLLDGETMPYTMRIRSMCMSDKSSLAIFLALCHKKDYALYGKYQLVKIKMTLKETQVGAFPSSILMIEKVSTLEKSDLLIRIILSLNEGARESYIPVYERDDIPASDEDAADPTDDDETNEPPI